MKEALVTIFLVWWGFAEVMEKRGWRLRRAPSRHRRS
jgi:hypothetical protein